MKMAQRRCGDGGHLTLGYCHSALHSQTPAHSRHVVPSPKAWGLQQGSRPASLSLPSSRSGGSALEPLGAGRVSAGAATEGWVHASPTTEHITSVAYTSFMTQAVAGQRHLLVWAVGLAVTGTCLPVAVFRAGLLWSKQRERERDQYQIWGSRQSLPQGTHKVGLYPLRPQNRAGYFCAVHSLCNCTQHSRTQLPHFSLLSPSSSPQKSGPCQVPRRDVSSLTDPGEGSRCLTDGSTLLHTVPPHSCPHTGRVQA